MKEVSYKVACPDGVTYDEELVTALHPYAGQRSGDLTFAAGDTITVLSKKANGWWVGHLARDGPDKKGDFPSNYVTTRPPAPPLPR